MTDRDPPPTGTSAHDVPPMTGILETVLYYPPDREAEVERFYREILGMRPIGHRPRRFLFFRAGAGVFLLFTPEHARGQRSPPPHGAEGPGHTCFRVPRSAYRRWKDHLVGHGVEVEEETTWPRGGHSFYFRDPAGNALEIADRDLWPLAEPNP